MIVDRLEDVKGVKLGADEIPKLGKRLKVRLCTTFPLHKPSFYVHVISDHSHQYLEELKRISQKVGFPVTLKMLAQDAVEAAHRFDFFFFFFLLISPSSQNFRSTNNN